MDQGLIEDPEPDDGPVPDEEVGTDPEDAPTAPGGGNVPDDRGKPSRPAIDEQDEGADNEPGRPAA